MIWVTLSFFARCLLCVDPSIAVAWRSFRRCWELFLRHVAEDAPFVPTLLEGAKGVQLAEAAYQSARERRWVDVPTLSI